MAKKKNEPVFCILTGEEIEGGQDAMVCFAHYEKLYGDGALQRTIGALGDNGQAYKYFPNGMTVKTAPDEKIAFVFLTQLTLA